MEIGVIFSVRRLYTPSMQGDATAEAAFRETWLGGTALLSLDWL